LDKLIITTGECDNSMHAGLPKIFTTPQAVADSTVASREAGVSIVHIHGAMHSTEMWDEPMRLIRERSDVIIQAGISAQPLEARKQVLALKPDMASVASMHNLDYGDRGVYGYHTREELLEVARICKGEGIKPEFEIFNLGDAWTFQWLIDRGAVDPPYYATLFFGRPGGQWTPATLDEYLQRIRYLPEGTIYTMSVTGPEHFQLEVTAMLNGGHVRIGREDEPFFFPGVLSSSNREAVEQMVAIATACGREVATPDETRAMLGMPARR
jgi:3-keto-5-aminohexanoate cleavage enzyme